jgi:hypothetical protein
MALNAPARVPLGGQTLNHKWWIDVNTGTYGSPTWTPVSGVRDFKPFFTPTKQDDSDFDSGGAKSKVVTAYEWGVNLSLGRKVTVASATVYDPGQEKLRDAAAEMGLGNVLDIRYYEMNLDDTGATVNGPKAEAYRGYVVADWGEDGGGMDALDSCSVVLDGRGARTPITHPETATAAVPVINGLSPYTDVEAGGLLITISGSNFTGTLAKGADGVKFGTTEADAWTVLNDNVIVAIAPAHAAGSVNVTVENATGVSISTATFVYTVA